MVRFMSARPTKILAVGGMVSRWALSRAFRVCERDDSRRPGAYSANSSGGELRVDTTQRSPKKKKTSTNIVMGMDMKYEVRGSMGGGRSAGREGRQASTSFRAGLGATGRRSSSSSAQPLPQPSRSTNRFNWRAVTTHAIRTMTGHGRQQPYLWRCPENRAQPAPTGPPSSRSTPGSCAATSVQVGEILKQRRLDQYITSPDQPSPPRFGA